MSKAEHAADAGPPRFITPRAGKAGLALVLVVPLVLFALFACQPPEVVVRYFSDDAYYYLQVADHLRNGNGPTFDGVTTTTGFHPLYAAVLAGLARAFDLTLDSMVPCAIWVNALAFGLTGLLLYATVRRLWGPGAGWWGPLIWFSCPDAILLVATGMEGAVYAACLAAFLCHAVHVAVGRTPRRIAAVGEGLLLGALAGLCILARSDAVLVVAVVGLGLLFIRTEPISLRLARLIPFGLIAVGTMAAWAGYCWLATGQPTSGSGDMKLLLRELMTRDAAPWDRFAFGAGLFFTWIAKSLAKVPLLKYAAPFFVTAALGPGLLHRPRAVRPLLLAACSSIGVLGMAYACLLPHTWTWYYAPSLVFLSLLTAGSLHAGFSGCVAGAIGRRVARALPFLLALGLVESYGYLAVKIARGRNRYQQEALSMARWMAANLPADARAAAWNTGIYAWYSGRSTINLDGLINNEIHGVLRRREPVVEYLRRRGVRFVIDDATDNQREWFQWKGEDYRVVIRTDGTHKRSIVLRSIDGAASEGAAGRIP
jgi:hypothetical protein